MTLRGKLPPRVPHVFQPVDGQQVRGHGKVQLVDEGGHLGRRIQQVDDGAAQVVELGLKPREQTGQPALGTPIG